MPNLQIHMLRVAGVAFIICDSYRGDINMHDVVAACLLHDMGNIIKFKLDLYPKFLQPEGLGYWQEVQDGFKKKYGNREDEATYRIVGEITNNKNIVKLVKSIAFAKAPENYKHNNFEKKICAYSDMRVIPIGITSAKDRMEEGRKRYLANKNMRKEDTEAFLNCSSHILKIEKQIFSKTKVSPEYITDKRVNSLLEELREFEIN